MKILLQLNCSSPCGDPTASKGGLWQSSVVSGGGGGAWMLGEGLGEEKEEEDGSFMLLYVFVSCNTRLGELIQLYFLYFGKNFIFLT